MIHCHCAGNIPVAVNEALIVAGGLPAAAHSGFGRMRLDLGNAQQDFSIASHPLVAKLCVSSEDLPPIDIGPPKRVWQITRTIDPE